MHVYHSDIKNMYQKMGGQLVRVTDANNFLEVKSHRKKSAITAINIFWVKIMKYLKQVTLL